MNEEFEKMEEILRNLSFNSLGHVISDIEEGQILHGQGWLGERLEGVKRDYELMRDFMLRGGKDTQREIFYQKLKHKVYAIVADARVALLREQNNTMKQSAANIPMLFTLLPDMLTTLESFDTDLAMAELEGDGAENQKKAIRQRQHDYRQQYFKAIYTSYQISETEQAILTSILLSPTVDRTDQDLIISALMLALQTQYDNNKFLALLRAFRDCQDEYIHAHLMVALALTMHDASHDIFHDTDSETLLVFSEENVRKELLQLQIQTFLCNNVDEVDHTLKTDIIPTIMKHQKPTDILKDDTFEGSSLDEILKPNTSEESIDELEETIARMDNMQKSGLDIYFGGFSKMKRDGFFYTLVNWFYPFTTYHPQLSHLPSDMLHGNMVKMLVEGSPLCDSDMYSMVIGMHQVYSMLPQNFKEMFERKEMKIREAFDRNTPAYYRRTYLQNLLRFYRLYTSKHDFVNPFLADKDQEDEYDKRWFFMNHTLFTQSGLFTDELVSLTKYLFKKGKYDLTWVLINNVIDHNTTDAQKKVLMLINGLASYEKGFLDDAAEDLQDVLDIEPDNTVALKYYIMTLLGQCKYNEVADYALHLHELKPDDVTFHIYHIVARIGKGDTEEASQELFRMYYENPDDIEVQRHVAWAYLHLRKPEKAAELFDKLIENDNQSWTTLTNAIYAYIATGNIQKVKQLYPALMKVMKEQDVQNNEEIINILMLEERLVALYNITRTDLEVVLDCC